jgi:hypothetical protein
MPPGEHLDGTSAECAHLHLLLACFRASPPPMRLPEVTGRPLPEVLGTGIIDPDVFRAGRAIMAARYEQLGIRALLPLERVWAGTRSAARPGTARGHGGFHHPAQGYRIAWTTSRAGRTSPSRSTPGPDAERCPLGQAVKVACVRSSHMWATDARTPRYNQYTARTRHYRRRTPA